FGIPRVDEAFGDLLHGVVESKPTPRVLKPGRKPGSKRQGDYTRPHRDVARRIARIVDALERTLIDEGLMECDLLVVESPSYGSKPISALEGTYWAVLARLEQYVPIVDV